MIHEKSKQILRGTTSYAASNVVNSAATFLASMVVSSYLGKEGLGIYSVSFAVVLIGVLLSELGLNPIIMREFSRSDREPLVSLRFILLLRFGASVFVAICVLAGAAYLKLEVATPPLLGGLGLLIISRSVGGAAENILKAHLRHLAYFVLTAGNATVQVLVVLAMLRLGLGIGSVVLSLAGIDALKGAVLLVMVSGEPHLQSAGNRSASMRLRPLLAQCVPFILIGLLVFLNERGGLLLLASLGNAAVAGVYAASSRFLVIGNIIDSSLLSSTLPTLASLKGDADRRHVTGQVFAGTIAVSAVIACAMFFGASFLISTTFRFSESVVVLRILSLALPAILANRVARTVLYALDKERAVAGTLALACAANLVLNILAIPRFGAAGAAGVAVATEYGVALVYTVLYLKFTTRDAQTMGVTP